MTDYFLISAIPFGYGPASKAVAIAESLRLSGAKSYFLGDLISLELASRSLAFDDVFSGDIDANRLRKLIKGARANISVMDESFASTVIEENCPLVVVDSLFWMWNKVPSVYISAQDYFVQDFIGVKERAKSISPPPHVVGPILGAITRNTSTKHLVVNIGGVNSPFKKTLNEPSPYLFMVATLLEAILKLETKYSFDIIHVIGGRNAISQISIIFPTNKIQYNSLPVKEARSFCSSADLVITPPGLTTMYECSYSNTPTLFLPPQNYSQWLALKALKKDKLAPFSTHWAEFLKTDVIKEGMNEEDAVRKIYNIIDSYGKEQKFQNIIIERLLAGIKENKLKINKEKNTYKKQAEFNGAEEIANILLEKY